MANRRKLTEEERRALRLSGSGTYDWQRARVNPALGRYVDGAKIEWMIIDELNGHPTRVLGFEGVEYDDESWVDPALWDAAADDGARVLRCGHCGASTDFNVRDHLDVLCEGCGTTYMARPTDPE